MNGWIETYTGKKVFPLYPTPQSLCIEDIAHSLSLTCRFAGHCSELYSVAQHCCLVSDLLDEPWKMAGLLHDAAEAYLGDVVSPIKPFCRFDRGKNWGMTEFDYHEDLIICTIHNSGIADIADYFRRPEKVKAVDRAVLIYEHRYLMPGKQKWKIKATPLSRALIRELPPLKCWTWRRSEKEFLKRYKRLADG